MKPSKPKYYYVKRRDRYSTKILAALKFLTEELKNEEGVKRWSEGKRIRKITRLLSTFYPEIEEVGSGVYRKVFYLNDRVIVKMTHHSDCRSNMTELKAFRKHP